MKCPNCEYPRLRYNLKVQSGKKRTDFSAECPKCKWTGEIGNEKE